MASPASRRLCCGKRLSQASQDIRGRCFVARVRMRTQVAYLGSGRRTPDAHTNAAQHAPIREGLLFYAARSALEAGRQPDLTEQSLVIPPRA